MQKRILLLVAVAVLLMLLILGASGCLGGEDAIIDEGGPPDDDDDDDEEAQVIKDLGNTASYDMITERSGDSDFAILDIRTPGEFDSGHIEGAVNIDFYEDTFEEELDKLDKTRTYVVYCRTANRSGQAMPTFRELGFLEVYNMLGGIVEWEENGYPVVTG